MDAHRGKGSTGDMVVTIPTAGRGLCVCGPSRLLRAYRALRGCCGLRACYGLRACCGCVPAAACKPGEKREGPCGALHAESLAESCVEEWAVNSTLQIPQRSNARSNASSLHGGCHIMPH